MFAKAWPTNAAGRAGLADARRGQRLSSRPDLWSKHGDAAASLAEDSYGREVLAQAMQIRTVRILLVDDDVSILYIGCIFIIISLFAIGDVLITAAND